MVEGPGATRNNRKARAAIGCVVRDVSPERFREKIQNKRLDQVFSVGKEVFLVFEDDTNDNQEAIALRLHFGMAGCLYSTQTGKLSSVPPWRRNKASSLALKFESSSPQDKSAPAMSTRIAIETKDATTSLVSAKVAKSKLARLGSRDVCASNFDPDAVMKAILEKRSAAMITDAILDQERFPGVGNIIKIEGLHRARIHPRRTVSALSKEELESVIRNCREYAMAWLSSGRAPKKAVYNQTICGTCTRETVKMVKMGHDLSRVTFWCTVCQPFSGDKENTGQHEIGQQTEHVSLSDAFLRTAPCCPQHGSASLLLRRVRSVDSPNRNRIFRSCKIRSCPYFSWADSHFPSCRCQQTTMLRISKTERSGGQWFLSCRHNSGNNSKQRRSGCSFFSWAQPAHLKPFGRSLTPLM